MWSRARTSGCKCGPGLGIRLKVWSRAIDDRAVGVVQGWTIKLRVCSRQEDLAVGVVKGWGFRLWVWSRARTSGCKCGPGQEDKAEGVVQGWTIKLRVSSRAGRSG